MAIEKQKCMIIGASPIRDKRIFQEFDPGEHYVICADGGYETALSYGIHPDLVVGDFDSAKKRPPKSLETVPLPVDKDVTDTMFAAIRGISIGFTSFTLLGCLGGERFDHSIANLEVLQYILAHGGHGMLADETTRIFLIHDERLRITEMKGATLSVFPYNGSACNVTYAGLQYPLARDTLTCGGLVMGVSNRIVEEHAEIRVHSGTALVIVSLL